MNRKRNRAMDRERNLGKTSDKRGTGRTDESGEARYMRERQRLKAEGILQVLFIFRYSKWSLFLPSWTHSIFHG